MIEEANLSRDILPLKFAFQRERDRNGFEEPGVQRALREDRPGGGWGGLPQVHDCAIYTNALLNAHKKLPISSTKY